MRITIFTIITIISLFTTVSAAKSITERDVKQALKELDGELNKRRSYMEARQVRIDSIHEQIKAAPDASRQQLNLLMALGDSYDGYLADSAEVAYERGEEIARLHQMPDLEMRFKLKKLVTMTLTGFGAEAAHTFQEMSPESLPDSLKVYFYNAGR